MRREKKVFYRKFEAGNVGYPDRKIEKRKQESFHFIKLVNKKSPTFRQALIFSDEIKLS